MDRRQAIKNIGIGAVATVYSGSLLALLDSCKSEAASGLAWKPAFFTSKQAVAVEKALDVILPTTDTPGAVELGVHRFIDKYVKQVSSKEEQNGFKEIANQFIKQFESTTGKSITDGTTEDFEAIIHKNFTGSDNRDDAFPFLERVRYSGIWAWRNTREVGEKSGLFFYDPVPGKFVGCRPLDAEGDGKLKVLD